MKYFIAFFIVLLSCNSADNNRQTNDTTTTSTTTTPPVPAEDSAVKAPEPISKPLDTNVTKPPVYANKRFQDVKVNRLGDGQFEITGRGQIFEANFGWIVEDGHEELASGYTMTDAGAPEWGNFRFTVNVKKKRPNSTLHLVLFESSAKDGSRQYELPVLLY